MLVLVFVAMVLIAGLVGLFFPNTTAPPKRLSIPLPNPNGYDTFVEAGSAVPGRTSISGIYYDVDTMSHDEVASWVDAASNALQLVRIGLQQACQVPWPDFSDSDSNRVERLKDLKLVAYTLMTEGRLAEMENRPADAAKSYLDTIQLGISSYRGGLLIDELVGRAIEDLGARRLPRLKAALDAQSCRDIASRLEALDSGRELWNNISELERYRDRNHPGLRYRLTRLFTGAWEEKYLQSEQERFEQQSANTRRLAVEFASRAFELDHQQKPASFADLVPAYLKNIPQDPLTGTNMTLPP
jgi:hypothetical protein